MPLPEVCLLPLLLPLPWSNQVLFQGLFQGLFQVVFFFLSAVTFVLIQLGSYL